MTFLEIGLIGIGLSMDAVAVTMTNSMVYKNAPKSKVFSMPVFFGVFQGLMPLLGFLTGSLFSKIINQYAGILTLIILGLIGFNMIKEGLSHDADKHSNESDLTFKTLILQSIATSIDAFAVGVSFCAQDVEIFSASGLIALTTFLCAIAAIFLGKKIGDLLGHKAHILGGVILLIIGIKSIL